MNLQRSIGIDDGDIAFTETSYRWAKIKLIAAGLPAAGVDEVDFNEASRAVLGQLQEQSRLLADHRCPADQRIETFLADHLAQLGPIAPLRLPSSTIVLERHGLARVLSIPADRDSFSNDLVDSYRVRNGVLHNPRSDRRTTQGTFHVAEGGLAVPGDKKAVPLGVFAALFRHAMNPPADLQLVPFTAGQSEPARGWASLLLRPMVCPEVPGVCPRRTMETRFFAPASLVSNLDFVESIFGNAGDPFLPENDAALDVEHWTGHTGCVILAPHLVKLTKKSLGLPHIDQATARQKRDGMCWADAGETYNDGAAFKVTCRDHTGVIVTLIADNYFGYCKKEVKTQISYAANLYGNVEEEHSGGAIAFPSFSYGTEFRSDTRAERHARKFDDVIRDYASFIDLQPPGYGVDRQNPKLIYIPEGAAASVHRHEIWWQKDGVERAIPLEPDKTYMLPSGFHLRFEKHPGAPSWRIVGTSGDGVFCHKPCTVSGGGKSEISKSLRDYMIYGPIFVADVEQDLARVDMLINFDYSKRLRPDVAYRPDYSKRPSRPLLSPERTLGSVIKLLTPTPDYTDEFNAMLASIPGYIYPIVFIIKRFYKPEWSGDWRSHFSVDVVNGFAGQELKLDDRKLVGTYLRVGLTPTKGWRTFKLRQDFISAFKLQMEDDITASVVVPGDRIAGSPAIDAGRSYKFSANCEYRLFQRPDDAIEPGLDKQTESDLSRTDNFLSNFQPLTVEQAQEMLLKVADLESYTPPMRQVITAAAQPGSGYFVCSSRPRLVGGKPSKNPRYLQIRPDLTNPMSLVIAERSQRLAQAVPAGTPVYTPVDAVLAGRRNNPPDAAAGIRALAVCNPIHYQELPELFMDFICSLTGKSPSTTGAGSEGALTKSPFNAVRPTADLNNALVSYILTGLGGFSTSAGYVGPKMRVDHDISLLIPELWCRLSPQERDPQHMIRVGHLEPVRDFVHEGEKILASRLGYRITSRFGSSVFGRVFDNPGRIFEDAMLRPETQDMQAFVDGVKNITEAQQRVASGYLEDGSIEEACPPLKALLTIMATGSWDGKDVAHPDFRKMFTRDYLLNSDWYRQRLLTKQRRDIALWEAHVQSLDAFFAKPGYALEATRLNLAARRTLAAVELARVKSPKYLAELVGTLGADPMGEQTV